MAQVQFNFDHPFQGKVWLRRTGCTTPWCNMLHFDSKGKHDFEIPLDVPEDGIYQVLLDWEFEGRSFFYEAKIAIRDGRRIAEQI